MPLIFIAVSFDWKHKFRFKKTPYLMEILCCVTCDMSLQCDNLKTLATPRAEHSLTLSISHVNVFAFNKSTSEKEIINTITAYFIFWNITARTRRERRRKEGKNLRRSIFENNYLQFVLQEKVSAIRMMENDGWATEEVSFFRILPLSYCWTKITTETSSAAKQQTGKARIDGIIFASCFPFAFIFFKTVWI